MAAPQGPRRPTGRPRRTGSAPVGPAWKPMSFGWTPSTSRTPSRKSPRRTGKSRWSRRRPPVIPALPFPRTPQACLGRKYLCIFYMESKNMCSLPLAHKSSFQDSSSDLGYDSEEEERKRQAYSKRTSGLTRRMSAFAPCPAKQGISRRVWAKGLRNEHVIRRIPNKLRPWRPEAMMLPLLDSNNQPVRRSSVAEARS